MKFVVKFRKPHGSRHFQNVVEKYTITRGERAGRTDIRDRLFDTYEEAEEVRKCYAIMFGEQNTKIVERKG